ncbi:MAG TPA: type II secretion system inner membrane protein GspF [Polyangiaceae bacterium LLY-WYZ-15_(1-7)]|nr:type II secretion system protein GspF [Sandaracinus sp.]HJL06060.1 type II secretion system inner membrane protein GspF [Polyangiaceae bacterium LLY-WYZ-15_(1-7)]MBJ72762.1 type II secretion system protein GspF [Sandaracinus sp.]HJL07014.1 type II secretion system inner membrane protein GspF [Polyangiaceae bacterium LLY-WYZ-15_(1-7)]HJL28085.1 type II secretion system inner membrane protein GspF [Polyangiaceae bacterium LLY-WYZ-15_(1-7)]
MAVYAWKGINASGKSVKGVRDADSPKALRSVLKRDGVLVTEVLEQSEAAKKNRRELDFKKFFKRVGSQQIAIATQQLAVLLRAGIPLVEALTALIDQLEHEELKAAFTDVRDKVNEGTSFADALRNHPKFFSGLFVNMVAAGEASGTLEAVLQRLAEFLEAQAKLKGKVQSALAYPAFMTVASLLIIVIMMTVVVPKVTAIFEDFDQALPWYTELLIWTSDIVTGWWWLLIALFIGGIIGFRRWKATDEGRAKWDRFILKIPLFGQLFLMVAVSRFSRTLSTLLTSGVPVLRAMEITSKVLGNVELQDVMEEARKSVREGEGIAKPLRQSGRFPPIVTHMIAIGERSGQLEEMLEHVAAAYDQQVDVRVQTLTSLLEPLIIVIMGGISGAIAFSILMPLLQINEFVG